MKLKEITIGGGGTISLDYQSVPFTASITVVASEGEKFTEAYEKASKSLEVMLNTEEAKAQKKLDRLVNQKREAEMAEIKTAWDTSGKDNKPDIVKDTLGKSEEVLMDLKEVTIMVITEKAILVSKQGYQKWIPLSQVDQSQELNEGDYIDLALTDKGEGWIHKKGWDKLEVRKK